MSTVDELSRSAPITTVSPPPEPPSSEVQPVSPASISVEATTNAVARRGSRTAVPPRGADTRYTGGNGDRPRASRLGQHVRLIAPNLANVKAAGQAGADRRSETTVSHIGWNLDVAP